ncbi:MAG: SsrA-binding protein SmpB [Bacilli bacterium]
MGKAKGITKDGVRLIASNRKANFEYFLSEFLEVGISLCGTEIKSIRQGHCSLSDTYITFKNGEAIISGMNIPEYEKGNIFNHDPKRDRKLLMHKYEIRKYFEASKEKGFTVVATKCYLKKGKAKLVIALAKGKNTRDKRDVIKKREVERNISKTIKEFNS